ncbi:unnamed protein product [Durusdinium trenchii]|uniref:aspartate--tRNA ligase n=1 Tax=Durusdinium trenchii TaxID=1381693 RepID=A0ABP0T1R1_9DINO
MYRVADRMYFAPSIVATRLLPRQTSVLRSHGYGPTAAGALRAYRRRNAQRDRKGRYAEKSSEKPLCFAVAAGLSRVSMSTNRRRLSSLPRSAENDNLGSTVTPAVATSSDGPTTGVYETIRSTDSLPVDFTSVNSLGVDGISPEIGAEVWIRARVATIRVKGKSTFVVLRQNSLHTVQACKFKEKEDGGESAAAVARFFKSISLESIVDVCGVLAEANVSSCTQNNVELQIRRVFCVSHAAQQLPFLLADAQRSEEEILASQGSKRPFVRVLPDLRLDSRWLDLRVPAHNAILRIQSAVCRSFRESLSQRGFVEIHSPKLISGESEGGAEVFRVDYFGSKASLAQSPQLYKQMAMSADLPGAFEVGPVFRAENSNTARHLCEFTGLDFEMPIRWHYEEVIKVIHETLSTIFHRLEEEQQEELTIIRKMYPSEAPRFLEEPCVLHWEEAMELLSSNGAHREDIMEDLSTGEEKMLGNLVREKYGTDLFFLDQYPSAVRPFYTMPSHDRPEFSNSYDVIFCGQEIGSGAQRCHDPQLLEGQGGLVKDLVEAVCQLQGKVCRTWSSNWPFRVLH